MLYEIINPSDPYTIEANSIEVAFVACLLLGNGQYAFAPINERTGEPLDTLGIPFLMVGGAATWCAENLGADPKTVAERILETERRFELADCFESCVIGCVRDRILFNRSLAYIDDEDKKAQWRAEFFDMRRSSLNDIGGRALEMAKNIRKGGVPFGEPAPQQVFVR